MTDHTTGSVYITIRPDTPIVARLVDDRLNLDVGTNTIIAFQGTAAERLLDVLGTALYGVDGDGAEVTAEPLSAPVTTTAVGSPARVGGAA